MAIRLMCRWVGVWPAFPVGSPFLGSVRCSCELPILLEVAHVEGGLGEFNTAGIFASNAVFSLLRVLTVRMPLMTGIPVPIEMSRMDLAVVCPMRSWWEVSPAITTPSAMTALYLPELAMTLATTGISKDPGTRTASIFSGSPSPRRVASVEPELAG